MKTKEEIQKRLADLEQLQNSNNYYSENIPLRVAISYLQWVLGEDPLKRFSLTNVNDKCAVFYTATAITIK